MIIFYISITHISTVDAGFRKRPPREFEIVVVTQ